MFSGMGTFLYLGKSDTSSGDGALVSAGGLSIWGGWMKGSFKWASPSIKTADILRYLAAFFNIDAINLNILFLINSLNNKHNFWMKIIEFFIWYKVVKCICNFLKM